MFEQDRDEVVVSPNEISDSDYFASINVDSNDLFSLVNRSNDIARGSNTSSIIQGMLDLMVEVTQAKSANFFQLDLDSDEYVISYVRGEKNNEIFSGLRLNHEQVFPDISLKVGVPLVLEELPVDPFWLRSVDPGYSLRNGNLIILSISTDNQTYGVVQILDSKTIPLEVLTFLGDRLAIEIDHRVELEDSLKSNKRLWDLVDIIGKVGGTLDRNQLLRLVTENVSVLINAERSSIYLVDPDTNEMLYQVAYRSPNPDITKLISSKFDYILPFKKTKNLTIEGKPIQNGDRQKRDNEFFNRSAITVPLRSDSLSDDPSLDQKSILGGLMAQAKPESSFQEQDSQLMKILANQTSTFLQVAEMYESAGNLFLGIIKALTAAIDAKDPYTQGHSQRVSDYSVLISNELGLGGSLVYDIRIGSLLHDIGKIGIPDSILLKKGKLTPEEYAIIQQHPNKGENILKGVKLLEPMLPAIAEHHERLNGSGYPYALTGQQISLMGRIVAVADVFDAMTSHRPYRAAISVPDVLSYLREQAGIQFETDCVHALENIIAKANQNFGK